MAGKGNKPMAARHGVENPIRLGNIFYWRARVPTSFARCRPGSRLSLSLRCSDHKKAQAIGRKLNMLMAEMKMKSKESMSKEQLQKLFEQSATSCSRISRTSQSPPGGTVPRTSKAGTRP
ncbi:MULTISPECIES: DUF6538 domain-containing protein [unclassified Sinorhizobium]|uniref:DUF6538 domain-containing protein n=1 Tax=unclassified Sinorhizobium TaxID=2613772 RepID=UPI0024C44FC1|nr:MULTISPECIES: DUF6538 domain-containing protein [unclassified Sinorhizobium]MDK1378161.1 hypothetical protein [Sinorhizobium sp. 6-70]MDK1479790.1 hypothetical protein [Sinorhizobium sp. 6-117]